MAHFGLAQQLLELRLRQEAVFLTKAGTSGPIAIVHGAVDLHVLVQNAQELLLPWKRRRKRWGPLL